MTSKEIVYNTLKGANTGRTARQLWSLPWAGDHYPAELKKIKADFPDDITAAYGALNKPPVRMKGNPYEAGEYTDEWGCVFTNCHKGIIGEVKKPLVTGDEWEDVASVHIPEEFLSFEPAQANAYIKEHCADKFVTAPVCPRPFEQLQFIRGTENLYMDLMYRPSAMMDLIEKMHDHYCRLLKKWAQTDIDCLMFMDDWGSQNSLLISPQIWTELFMPLYRDYIDIAHKAGKKAFMHSDGNTLSIIPSLIDIGLDAINTQLFCIGVDNLRQFRGHITFWGEIDRQHLLPRGSTEEVGEAVKRVHGNLYKNGFCIAQCEFGAGAKPENVYKVFETWDKLTGVRK